MSRASQLLQRSLVAGGLIVCAAVLIYAPPRAIFAGQVGALNTFQAGQIADASAVNDNFTAIVTAVDDNAADIAALEAAPALFTGEILPPLSWWNTTSNDQTWTELWGDSVILAVDSIVLVSVNGHWLSNGSFGGLMIDGAPIHELSSYPDLAGLPMGATYINAGVWDPVGYSVSVELPAGTYRLGFGVFCQNTTVSVNGGGLYYTVIPKG